MPLTWHKHSLGGYQSACGRFRVRPAASPANRAAGWRWTVADERSPGQFASARTAAEARRTAEGWGRRGLQRLPQSDCGRR